jgi:hypothetical protein
MENDIWKMTRILKSLDQELCPKKGKWKMIYGKWN